VAEVLTTLPVIAEVMMDDPVATVVITLSVLLKAVDAEVTIVVVAVFSVVGPACHTSSNRVYVIRH
jgi:hypothetical protein